MRFIVTAAVLAFALRSIALTQAADLPGQTPGAGVQVQRPRLPRVPSPGTNPKTAAVPPETPVVTLQGLCGQRQSKGDCRNIITRADLDDFVKLTSPEASEAERGRLAVQYAGSLAFSTLAERQGFEKDPEFARQLAIELKLTKMRILAAAYLQGLQRQVVALPESEIQKYYEDHRSEFEQARVRRIAVPFAVPTENGRPLDRAAVKLEMEELRSRALAGEDLNGLQQDAFKHLHIQAPPPPVTALTMRRTNTQGEEAKALDLNAGELSPVLEAPAAFAIIKVEAKEPLPIAFVRPEIEAAVRRDRMQEQVRAMTKEVTTQFNLDYLGLTSQPDIFDLAAANPAPRNRVPRTSRLRTEIPRAR